MILIMIFALTVEGKPIQQDHQRQEIRGVLSIASAMFNLTFQQSWITGFLNLFSSKQQITTFFEYFNEAYNYSINQNHMEIEAETSNTQLQMDSFDMLELQPNESPQNRPKQEINSGMFANQMSQTQYISVVESIIESNPYVKLQSICDRLKQLAFQQTPSMQSIQNMLKSFKYRQKNLNKISIDRNSMVNLQNRYKYCFEYHHLIQSKAKIFFIDVCKVDMNLAAEWIWIKDKQPIFQRINDDYIQIMNCLSQNEPIICDFYSRSKGDMSNDTSKIERIVNAIGQRYRQENIVIIINSLNMPISKQIKRILMRHNWRLFVLPPLSPQLNPASFFFRQIKASIRNTSNIIHIDQLYQSVTQMCHKLSQNCNYFQQMKPYIIKGLTKSYF